MPPPRVTYYVVIIFALVFMLFSPRVFSKDGSMKNPAPPPPPTPIGTPTHWAPVTIRNNSEEPAADQDWSNMINELILTIQPSGSPTPTPSPTPEYNRGWLNFQEAATNLLRVEKNTSNTTYLAPQLNKLSYDPLRYLDQDVDTSLNACAGFGADNIVQIGPEWLNEYVEGGSAEGVGFDDGTALGEFVGSRNYVYLGSLSSKKGIADDTKYGAIIGAQGIVNTQPAYRRQISRFQYANFLVGLQGSVHASNANPDGYFHSIYGINTGIHIAGKECDIPLTPESPTIDRYFKCGKFPWSDSKDIETWPTIAGAKFVLGVDDTPITSHTVEVNLDDAIIYGAEARFHNFLSSKDDLSQRTLGEIWVHGNPKRVAGLYINNVEDHIQVPPTPTPADFNDKL